MRSRVAIKVLIRACQAKWCLHCQLRVVQLVALVGKLAARVRLCREALKNLYHVVGATCAPSLGWEGNVASMMGEVPMNRQKQCL